MAAIDDLSDQFDPLAPLGADDVNSALYVDWQAELDSDNVKELLTNAFIRRRNITKWRLLTGHRGVGKTTELYRVVRRLNEANIFTVFLNVDEWLDLDDVEPEDVIFQVIRQLVSDLEQHGISFTSKRAKEFLRRWDELRPDGFSLSWNFFKFNFSRKDLPGDEERAAFRRLLRGVLPTAIDLVNDEILTLADAKLAEKGYRDLVVVIDSLDKIPSTQRAHEVFIEGAGTLRALKCDVLFTVPIQLAYSGARNELSQLYDDLHLLPVLPTVTRQGEDHPEGIRLAREIIVRRSTRAGVKFGDVFESTEGCDALLRASGGHVRQLFGLLNRIMDRSPSLPLADELIMTSLRRSSQDLWLAVDTDEERRLLDEAHRTKAAASDGGETWNALLRNQLVFAYRDESGYWYDRNPLLGLAEPT